MKRTNKLLIAAGILFFIPVLGIFAQNATIRDLAGTVEILKAGSAEWEPAARGQSISGDTTISTGFRSSALIVLGDSLLTVRPLTRLTLKELSKAQNRETVQLNLQTGRVRAEVKAPAGARAEFSIQSPTATASVRGTIFEFDTFNLSVNEGTVEFAGASNVSVLVDAGRFSYSDERSGRAAPPETVSAMELRPELPIASDAISQAYTGPELIDSPNDGGEEGGEVTDNTGGIGITIGF